MAKDPTLKTNGNAAAAGQVKKRQSRPLGPRTLWLILKPGADAAALREQIQAVTFNGREVLKNMGTGETPSVIKMQVSADKRNPSEGSAESGTVEGEAEALEGVSAAA